MRRPTFSLAWLVLPALLQGCGQEDASEGPLANVRDTLAEDTAAWSGGDSLVVAAPGSPGPVPVDSLVGYLTERGGSPEGRGSLHEPLRPPSWTVKEIEVALRETGAVRTVESLATSSVPADGSAAAFDRVEVLLDGEVGEYEVEYVPAPIRECGSGHEMEVGGTAWIEIDLSRARGHRFVGEDAEATLPLRRATPELERVVEIVRPCDFEGMVSLVLAVDGATPFRAFHSEDGTRVVVDVRR